MHVRGQIREVFEDLVAGATGLDADHVFADTDEMLQAAEFPAACILCGDEEITHESVGGASGATLERIMDVHVILLYRANRDALKEAETILAAIETAIANSTQLLDLARSWFPKRISPNRDTEGSLPSVQIDATWQVTYSTNERDPTVAIP
jgi:hypothetical protein